MYFPENQAASVTRAPTPRPLGALQRVSDLSTRLQEPASPIQRVWVIWRREPQVNGQGVLSGAGAGAGAGRGSWSSLGPFHLDPVPQAGCWPQAACWLQDLQGSGWEMCRGMELKSVWGSSPAASTLQTWPTVKPSGLATGRSKLSPFLPPPGPSACVPARPMAIQQKPIWAGREELAATAPQPPSYPVPPRAPMGGAALFHPHSGFHRAPQLVEQDADMGQGPLLGPQTPFFIWDWASPWMEGA